jgi:hypothetical protein
LTDEIILGTTLLSRGGSTKVPRKVTEVLKVRYSPQSREKLLWMEAGDHVVVTKGTPQSSFRKTMLRRGERAAVPRHIQEALELKSAPDKEERILWIRSGKEIIVRKGKAKSRPTE